MNRCLDMTKAPEETCKKQANILRNYCNQTYGIFCHDQIGDIKYECSFTIKSGIPDPCEQIINQSEYQGFGQNSMMIEDFQNDFSGKELNFELDLNFNEITPKAEINQKRIIDFKLMSDNLKGELKINLKQFIMRKNSYDLSISSNVMSIFLWLIIITHKSLAQSLGSLNEFNNKLDISLKKY